MEALDSGRPGRQTGLDDMEHSDGIHTSQQPRRKSTSGQKRTAFLRRKWRIWAVVVQGGSCRKGVEHSDLTD